MLFSYLLFLFLRGGLRTTFGPEKEHFLPSVGVRENIGCPSLLSARGVSETNLSAKCHHFAVIKVKMILLLTLTDLCCIVVR